MAGNISSESILENISVLDNLYDVVRAVNPTMKIPIAFGARQQTDLESSCYDFWKQGLACENCISMRAFREDKTFIKLEYNTKRIYLVTAVPVRLQGDRVVIEMLKDVTESGIIEDLENRDTQSIYEEIKKKNLLIVTDSLTQVFNRRYMDERLPFELLEARLNNMPIALALVDIDGFKHVNDTYGHAAGDRLMQAIADLLQSEMRKKGDWVARQGGDEFCILLKDTDKNNAIKVLERIRKRIQEQVFSIGEGQSIRITLSIGVEMVQNNIITVEDLIKHADEKLYKAKRQGKNSIVWQ